MSNALIIALASITALAVVGGMLWVSLRMSNRKVLRSARGAATSAPALANEWVALNSESGSADCASSDSSGGCD